MLMNVFFVGLRVFNLVMRLQFWVIRETELLNLGHLGFYSRLNLALNSGLLPI